MLDFVASVLTLVSMHLVMKRRAVGWLVGILGQLWWVILAVKLSLWSMLVLECLLAVQCAKGWLDWTGRKHWYKTLPTLEGYYRAFNKTRVKPQVARSKQREGKGVQQKVEKRKQGSMIPLDEL